MMKRQSISSMAEASGRGVQYPALLKPSMMAAHACRDPPGEGVPKAGA